MAEININYTTGELSDGYNNNNNDMSSIEVIAEIPFLSGTINKTYFSSKVYTKDNKNYGLLIKKDPIIIDSNAPLITNTPILYSYNTSIDEVLGKNSNYGTKFYIYPCLDIQELIAKNYINKYRAKQLTGITNDYDFDNIYTKFYDSAYSDFLFHIPEYGLTNILGSGLECIFKKDNYIYSNDPFVHAAAYDIDINKLGINLPTDADRGINEETLELFNKENSINYRDQRIINSINENNYNSYYISYSQFILCELKNSKLVLGSRMKNAAVYSWKDNYKRCMPYAFSNIIINNGIKDDALFRYSYSIILMGVKKIEGV